MMKFSDLIRKLKGFLGIKYFKSHIPFMSKHDPSLRTVGNPDCNHIYFFKAQIWLKIGRRKFELNEKSVCKFCNDERFDKVSI